MVLILKQLNLVFCVTQLLNDLITILKVLVKIFHSDYFSGWEEPELQSVLDNCENYSDAANPDAFCSDFLTFRGKAKQEGVQVQDDDIRADLEKIQPPMVDLKGTISPEAVTGIPELLRGACTGTLIRGDSDGTTSDDTTSASVTDAPTNTPAAAITSTVGDKDTTTEDNNVVSATSATVPGIKKYDIVRTTYLTRS